MKKFTKRISIICCVLFAASFNAAALDDRVISTFESGTSGEVGFSSYVVKNSSGTTVTASTVYASGPSVQANDVVNSNNPSANCFKMVTANGTKRSGALVFMNTSVTPTTAQKYLKLKIRRDYSGNNFKILINGTTTTWNNTPSYSSTPSSVWQDVVINITTLATAGTPITTLLIEPVDNNSVGLGFPVTVCIDDVVLSENNLSRTATLTTPIISLSTTTFSNLDYTYGFGPSVEKSYTVSGINLIDNIVVTPPVPYEISLSSGSSFQSTPLTLTKDGSGNVATTTIYARLKAGTLAGAYTSPITNISLGAFTQNVVTAGTVYKKCLTIGGITVAASKVYDNATTATVSGASGAALLGDGATTATDGKWITGDGPMTYSGTFATATSVYNSKDVLAANYVTCGGLTLAGTGNANYVLGVPATITTKALTAITNPVVTAKVYDATTTASITGTFTGILGADVVTLTGTFNTKDVGTGKSVTATAVTGGTQGSNYTYTGTVPTGLTGNITAKALSISAASIASKVYDSNTTSGTVTPGALSVSGFINAETVTVSAATGTCVDANVGTGKTATIAYTLANGTNGGLAANYSLVNGSATGDITAATGSPTGTDLTNSGLTDNQLANTNLTISSGEFTINDTKTVRSLTIAPGAKLTHSSGTLTATNGITLESDATGIATFMDSNTEPTITATVQQYLPQGRNWYAASPIETNIATATNLSAAGASSVSYYNETSGWVNDYTGTLVEGVGYIAVSSAGTSTNKINITGKLNTGDVPVILTNSPSAGKGFNLVGNPYPSYLSWSAVVADNAVANMPSGTMWYRTTNYNGKSAWTASTVYSQDDIVYNGTRFYKATSVTGTSAASGGPIGSGTGIVDNGVVWNYEGSIYIFATVNASGVVAPETSPVSNLIPPMQAFWVKSTGGTLTFKNTMRTHNTGSANALKAPKSAASELKLLRLKVSNGASADEAVIYASADASNAFDTYDAPKYFNLAGSNQPEIYTQVGDEKLVINAMSELNQGTEIPLGFATEKVNNFTISASEFKNFGSNTKVMLKDKQTSAEFDLTGGQSYPFSSSVVKSTDRFSLIFRTAGVATGVDNTNKVNSLVFVNAANQITIVAPEKSNYAIYNALGQLIENGVINTERETRNTKQKAAGVYVVKVNNQSTRVIVK